VHYQFNNNRNIIQIKKYGIKNLDNSGGVLAAPKASPFGRLLVRVSVVQFQLSSGGPIASAYSVVAVGYGGAA
jgi:hypothetical protein